MPDARIPREIPMANLWFYAQNGQQTGPITAEQLEQLAHGGRLHETDLVWKEGLPHWVQANTVAGLFAKTEPGGLMTDSFLQRAAVPSAWGGGNSDRPQGGYAMDATPVDATPTQ